jgi:hypothetical protein
MNQSMDRAILKIFGNAMQTDWAKWLPIAPICTQLMAKQNNKTNPLQIANWNHTTGTLT